MLIQLIVAISFLWGSYTTGYEAAMCNPQSPIIAEHCKGAIKK